MSHQTGIKANDKLKKFFGKCKDGKIRAFKVAIVDEQMSLVTEKKVSKAWEEDFESAVAPMIETDEPCYILYRLDSKHSSGYNWLLISWCPDSAPIRKKMLYASTKSTLKQEFGTGDIADELHATSIEEISYRGYMDHKRNAQAPAPLTNREEELKELKRGELMSSSAVGIDTKHQTLSGVSFPIDPSALTAILDLRDSRVDYVQLKIDLEEERILLVEATRLALKDLDSRVPKDSARYHLYNFRHTYEGDSMQSIVFIYSMPGYSCSIKERMLYSSCKAVLMENLKETGLDIEKKMEQIRKTSSKNFYPDGSMLREGKPRMDAPPPTPPIQPTRRFDYVLKYSYPIVIEVLLPELIQNLEVDADDKLTEEFLMDEVHPKVNLHRPKFDKPKGPPNRGARRITKPQN